MIRRIVLDVLKPHKPTIIELANVLSTLKGVRGVNMSLFEVDRQTETVKVTIEGDNIDYSAVEKLISEFGGAVHSIDQVVAGREMVEEIDTYQEP